MDIEMKCMNFSEKLKDLRKKENLTQKELAAALGVSTATVISYENGNRRPSNKMLDALASYFSIPKSYFLDDIPSTNFQSWKTTVDSDITDIPPTLNKLLNSYTSLNDKDQETALKLLQNIHSVFSYDGQSKTNLIATIQAYTEHLIEFFKVNDMPENENDTPESEAESEQFREMIIKRLNSSLDLVEEYIAYVNLKNSLLNSYGEFSNAAFSNIEDAPMIMEFLRNKGLFNNIKGIKD